MGACDTVGSEDYTISDQDDGVFHNNILHFQWAGSGTGDHMHCGKTGAWTKYHTHNWLGGGYEYWKCEAPPWAESPDGGAETPTEPHSHHDHPSESNDPAPSPGPVPPGSKFLGMSGTELIIVGLVVVMVVYAAFKAQR